MNIDMQNLRMTYKVNYKIWIEADGELFLGPGKVQLLKLIDELGSLNKAAEQMKISYKKAWWMVNSANTTAKEPMLTTAKGGKGGGGTRLTEYGRMIITEYETMIEKSETYLKTAMQKNTYLQ